MKRGGEGAHESLSGRKGDAGTVAAGDDDSLAVDDSSKGLGNLDCFSVGAELGMSCGRHVWRRGQV